MQSLYTKQGANPNHQSKPPTKGNHNDPKPSNWWFPLRGPSSGPHSPSTHGDALEATTTEALRTFFLSGCNSCSSVLGHPAAPRGENNQHGPREKRKNGPHPPEEKTRKTKSTHTHTDTKQIRKHGSGQIWDVHAGWSNMGTPAKRSVVSFE